MPGLSIWDARILASSDTMDPRPSRLSNLLASWLLLAATLAGCIWAPHLDEYLTRTYHLFGLEFSGAEYLAFLALGYALALLLFYWLEPTPRVSKSVYCLRAVARSCRAPRGELSADERLGLLTTLLKAFFAPLMLLWLLGHAEGMLANGAELFTAGSRVRADFLAAFDRHGFWFLLQLVILADVFFFTIGYLIEHPRLGNEIRSVDPTWLGWLVTLACYPPFNAVSSAILGWHASDFPHFEDATAHVALNLLLLALMTVYASASVALNLKASNLTHRGIVTRGPYAFVRHPAYVCKNLAWWIAAIPAITRGFEQSLWEGGWILVSVVGWSMVYVLRALTEEDHLRRVDGAYDRYAARVRYRFVPGVY